MIDHERCDDVTCPSCSGLPDVTSEPPSFHLKPAGRREDISPSDGALYRVHTFYVVNEDDQIVTDDTMEGPQAIMIQSVPMRITRPVAGRLRSGLIVH